MTLCTGGSASSRRGNTRRYPRVVEGFIGHASRQGAIADYRNHLPLAALQIAANRHPQRGGDRGGAVSGAERIKRALTAFGKARQPARLPQFLHAITAAS